MVAKHIYLKDNNFCSNNGSQVLSAILEAVNSWRSIDELVTFALRKCGFGGDWFGITYPGDLDEYDKEVLGLNIPDGFVHITVDPDSDDIKKEELVAERYYLETLSECLMLAGMNQRVLILEKLISNDLSVLNLVEASPAKCNKRWNDFLPYLERFGWVKCLEVNEMIKSPDSKRSISTSYDGDLDVLNREMINDSGRNSSFVKAYEQYLSESLE